MEVELFNNGDNRPTQPSRAIRNGRRKITGEQMREVTAILEVISPISSTLALDDILAEFTEKTTRFVGVDSCTISNWNQNNHTVVTLVDYVTETEGSSHPPDDRDGTYPLADYPATATVLQEQKPLIIYYADDSKADKAELLLLKEFGWDGVLMIPMLYKGKTIGLMELYIKDKENFQFTEETVILCQALGNQAAIAIENARLYQEAEDGQLHAEAMQVIGRALSSELDNKRIVSDVADFAYRLVGAKFVCVTFPEEDKFRLVAMAGSDKTRLVSEAADLPEFLCYGPLEHAKEGKRPVIINDVQAEATGTKWEKKVKQYDWRSIVAIPLLSRNQLVGILAAYAHQPNFFNSGDVAILMSLASQAAVAIQNADLFAEIESKRETLRHLSIRLVNAQEDERRRISRELHDELGQTLTALKLNLDVVRQALPPGTSDRLQDHIQEASSLAMQTLEAARNLSLELHPSVLDDLGLDSALRWEIDRYEQRTQQAVQYETNLAEQRLQPELEITIYRITTEALTNVARHAQAEHISVRLWLDEYQLVAKIEDDGVGFDAENWFNSPAERQSLGLVSMQERAELLGGQFTVTSKPGCGTKVQVKIPTQPLKES